MGRLERIKEKRVNTLRQTVNELNPFMFHDYKDYLQRLYYLVKDKQQDSYSWIIFTEDLGLGACNAAWLIANGKRKMTEHTLSLIIKSLNLSGVQRKYFKILRLYTNSTEIKERENFLSQLLEMKKQSLTGTNQLELDFFSEWYHAVVFEMVGLAGFKSDPKWVADHVSPPISVKEAASSLKLLERLKCIKLKENTQQYIKVMNDFNTTDEVSWLGIKYYHKKLMDLAKEAMDQVGSKNREISNTSMTVSKKALHLIKQDIRAFRRYLNYLAQKETNPEVVIAVNIQMFPLTEFIETNIEQNKETNKETKVEGDDND